MEKQKALKYRDFKITRQVDNYPPSFGDGYEWFVHIKEKPKKRVSLLLNRNYNRKYPEEIYITRLHGPWASLEITKAHIDRLIDGYKKE